MLTDRQEPAHSVRERIEHYDRVIEHSFVKGIRRIRLRKPHDIPGRGRRGDVNTGTHDYRMKKKSKTTVVKFFRDVRFLSTLVKSSE